MSDPEHDDSIPLATIGRYVLYGPMAAGGIATVHYARAMDDDASPIVAVKRLHARYALDPAFSRMFIDEARIAAHIDHRNVIPLLDVVADAGVLFLVMPYIHGESLAKIGSRLRRTRRSMPSDIATAIGLDMLLGLHAAHETKGDDGQLLGIVHRDVSPQNVLIGDDGVARLFDFGVAKAQGRLTSTRQGEVKGKYPYMAPEQIQGREVTRRSDVYAAGVVLWEAIVGTRLFGGDDKMKIMERVLFSAIPPPSAVRPEIGTAFDDLLMRAIDRDASKRFATALEMAEALERAHPRARAEDVRAVVDLIGEASLAHRAATIEAIRRRSPSIDAELVREEIIGGFDEFASTEDEDSHLETVKAPTPIDEITKRAPRLLTPLPLTVVEKREPEPEPFPTVRPPAAASPARTSEAPKFRPDRRWGVLLFLAFVAAIAAGAAIAYLQTRPQPGSNVPPPSH